MPMWNPSFQSCRACSSLPEKLCTTPRKPPTRRIAAATSSNARRACRITRQIELACELELAIEIDILRVAIEILDVEIEPAFADGDRTLVRDPVGELGKMFGPCAARYIGCSPYAGYSPASAAAEVAQFGKFGQGDRRDDLPRHACALRAFDHGAAIAVELGGVEVAVAVNQRDHGTIVANTQPGNECVPENGRSERTRAGNSRPTVFASSRREP